MTETMIAPDLRSDLAVVYQYTVEAYKTFQKLAELLPNPLSASLFKSFAVEERKHRDLLDIRYAADTTPHMKITLGNDLRFTDILEGDLSYREMAEMLIVRERTMERRLMEMSKSAGPGERNLFIYIAAGKRGHAAMIQRELDMINLYSDWFRREDAENLIVYGEPHE